ncbi:MAG: class II aldolase/adducin family protein [Calditrichaeota bacterium]|nr:class II aldolase/adducin family protein [Calditrichota bacterium]MCB9366545.1 class II aldolase/adducin family protein [Calditrichota bacterium]
MDGASHELLHAARVLAAAGCLTATDGNFSARVGSSQVLVTRRGVEKRSLTASDLIVIELDEETPADASTEWPLHRALYNANPEVQSVLHVHAPHLGAFAAIGQVPNTKLLIEAEMTLGGIALIPFVEPGTAELGKLAVERGQGAGVLLLEKHGVATVGKSVREALHRLERAELLARIELETKVLLA